MKADNHEYYEIYNAKMVQVTYVVKNEQNYIELAKFFQAEGWAMSDSLIDRVDLAINRLLQHEAIYGQAI